MAERELQKLQDLLDMGFIHEEEYKRRRAEIVGEGILLNLVRPHPFNVFLSSYCNLILLMDLFVWKLSL